MDNNNPTTPQPTPETLAGGNPPATPAPTPEVGVEPTAPEPVVEPAAPEAPVAPEPVMESAPAPMPDAPVDAKPKKHGSAKIILIIVGVILLLGIGAFVAFYFLTHTPEKLVNDSVNNLFSREQLGVNLTLKTPAIANGESMTADALVNKDTLYFRINNVEPLLNSLFGSFSSLLGEDAIQTISNELSGKWWKADSTSETGSLDSAAEVLKNREKLVKAWKEHPFIKAEKINGKYSTSGDAYKLMVDKKEYEAFTAMVSDKNTTDDSSLQLENESLIDASTKTDLSSMNVIATIKSSLFGNAQITGIYISSTDETNPVDLTIDLEHAVTTAPADAKNISELSGILQSSLSGSTTDDTDEEEEIPFVDDDETIVYEIDGDEVSGDVIYDLDEDE